MTSETMPALDVTGTDVTTRVVPSAVMAVRISTGDWLDQFLAHNEPEIEACVQAGFRAVTSVMPYGGVVLGVVNAFGPRVIDDYVLRGVNYVRAFVHPMGIDVSSGHSYMTVIATLLNEGEKRFASFMGDDIHSMIDAGLKRIGIDVAPGYVPPATLAFPSSTSGFPPVKNPSGAIGGD